MAVTLSNPRGSSRPGSRYRPMADINVTPLVDVMLVLLVVFMITAPLLTVGVPVDLPQTAAPPINEPKEPTVITVNKEGEIFIQDTSIPMDGLVAKLQAVTNSNPDAVLYVRGDKDISYGKVLEVMSLISNAGFHKVSLVAEAPKGGPATPSAAPASGQPGSPPAQGSAPAHAGAR
jgi:biopolymer transport protein TolR